MRVIKAIVKTILFFLLIGLFLLPVYALYQISLAEQARYDAPVLLAGKEHGYGEPTPVRRMDMSETITIQAEVTSGQTAYMELTDYWYPGRIRWVAQIGDAVEEGETIAWYQGKPVCSEITGVLREISLGEKPYLRFDLLEDLILAADVDEIQLQVLQRDGLELQDSAGNALNVIDIDLIRGPNGTRVLLQYDNPGLIYGERFDKLTLSTGRVWRQVLVVDTACVYQKPGDESHYVRVLEESGELVGEKQVEVGYTNGTLICVSGIEDGTYCDPGYKVLVGGTANGET